MMQNFHQEHHSSPGAQQGTPWRLCTYTTRGMRPCIPFHPIPRVEHVVRGRTIMPLSAAEKYMPRGRRYSLW